MSYTTLEQKLRRIPERDFAVVSSFLDSLLTAPDTVPEKTPHMAVRQLGQWNGRMWMADDFDDTPDCLKDYQ